MHGLDADAMIAGGTLDGTRDAPMRQAGAACAQNGGAGRRRCGVIRVCPGGGPERLRRAEQGGGAGGNRRPSNNNMERFNGTVRDRENAFGGGGKASATRTRPYPRA